MEKYINIIDLSHSLGYTVSGLIIFIIGKITYKLLHPKINIQQELVDKDNFAFILSYVGYFTALIIVIGGTIVGGKLRFCHRYITYFRVWNPWDCLTAHRSMG